MKVLFSLFFLFFLIACSSSQQFKKDKLLFNTSASLSTYKAIADMNDSYFVIKENNFFEFYMQLFDSLKNTRYPGRYTKSGDTLHLHFYNKKGEILLGSNALINDSKKEIIFFDKKLGQKKKLIFN